MNPNSISHRLFVAALTPGSAVGAKHPPLRPMTKPASKSNVAKAVSAITSGAQKSNDWAWSGWQHTTI